MKILFVCGGGVIYGKETVTLSLMEGLRERGHDIGCITSIWGDAFAKELDTRSIPYIRLPLGFISKTLRWTPFYMTLVQLYRLPQLWLGHQRLMKSFDPDFVIHTNFHHFLLLWPLLDPRKTLFHVHDHFEPNGFYQCLLKFLALRIRAFISVSNFIRDSLLQVGISPSKVFSVLNGISLEAKSNHRIGTDPVRIGIVGQIAEWKGHGDLLEALRILKNWNVPFSCAIFGTGEPKYLETLCRRIHQYGLDEEIRWAGYSGDQQKIFGEIDICVIPSRCQEGFGMVAAEAACFGIPAIATRRGGLSEIVQDNVTGYLTEVESPLEIADKLKLFIKDPSLRQRMSQAARFHTSQHLTQSRMVQEIENLLLGMNHVQSLR